MFWELTKWILRVVGGAIFLWITKKYLYRPSISYIQSFFVVKKLLKETRPTRNTLRGKHLADRLLDIWNNGKPMPLISRNILYSRGNFWQGVWSENIVDKKLQEMNLVDVYEDRGVSQVKLRGNWLAKFVIKRLNNLVKRNLF